MDSNNVKEIEELLKIIGLNIKQNKNTENGEKKCKATIDPTGGAETNCCSNLDLDIPNGFQDVNPKVFIVVGEVLGNILSGSLPFNTINAVSNLFNLIGQVVETYSSQQQYFQSGPGRYYNPKYKNITNPFCSCNDSGESDILPEEYKNELKKIYDEINKLSKEFESKIQRLENEIEEIKKSENY